MISNGSAHESRISANSRTSEQERFSKTYPRDHTGFATHGGGVSQATLASVCISNHGNDGERPASGSQKLECQSENASDHSRASKQGSSVSIQEGEENKASEAGGDENKTAEAGGDENKSAEVVDNEDGQSVDAKEGLEAAEPVEGEAENSKEEPQEVGQAEEEAPEVPGR